MGAMKRGNRWNGHFAYCQGSKSYLILRVKCPEWILPRWERICSSYGLLAMSLPLNRRSMIASNSQKEKSSCSCCSARLPTIASHLQNWLKPPEKRAEQSPDYWPAWSVPGWSNVLSIRKTDGGLALNSPRRRMTFLNICCQSASITSGSLCPLSRRKNSTNCAPYLRKCPEIGRASCRERV